MIKFYDGGLWLGDSADRHSETIQSGTGLFVDVPNDKIYIYTNGERAEVSNQTNVAGLIQGLKDGLKLNTETAEGKLIGQYADTDGKGLSGTGLSAVMSWLRTHSLS